MYHQDNIVAIATANGYAGVGVLRVSGFNLLDIALKVTDKNNFKPRVATYCNFLSDGRDVLDSGILLYFPAPNSFTGEDVLELQCHGSPVVMQMLLKRCIELGCRHAEPGEFTKRAYLNHKIDLIQAESIIDLIHSESELAAKSAIRSLQGRFSNYINQISQHLIDVRMFVEATLDFPEEDIEFIANAKIKDKLTFLQSEMIQLLQITKNGVVLNNGANIAIIGRPNVGKSSLLNALANEDVAIVTAIAGTTRDTKREKVIINGVPFNIIDTAGIRDTQDEVEKIGISRAYDTLNSADLVLVIIDAQLGITPEDNFILQQIKGDLPIIFVHNKIDLVNKDVAVRNISDYIHVYISAKNNLGISDLRDEIVAFFMVNISNNIGTIFTARERHLDYVKQAINHIDYAFANWHNLELVAEELRYAHNSLINITGEYTADDLLGEIFSRFCIGK